MPITGQYTCAQKIHENNCSYSSKTKLDSGTLLKRGRTGLAIAACTIILTGCNSPTGTLWNKNQHIQGPYPVIDGEKIEEVDLIAELWGTRYSNRKKTENNDDTNIQLAQAYDQFYERVKSQNSSGKRLARNRIQNRILQASDQRCGVYINFLRRFETEGEFGLGALTTILAGAGAIVTGATAARSLAGSAGIAEGIRAEFKQAFFSNLATHIIVPGIENRRRIILEETVSAGRGPAALRKVIGNGNSTKVPGGIYARQELTLDRYPVELAVKDAIFYHAHCNLMAGLVEASDLISLGKRPGITAMNAALKEMGETRSLIDVLTGKPGPEEELTQNAIDLLTGASEATDAEAQINLKGVLNAIQAATANLGEADKTWQAALTNFGSLIPPETVNTVNEHKKKAESAIKVAKDKLPMIAANLVNFKTDGEDAKNLRAIVAELVLADRDVTAGTKTFVDAVANTIKTVKQEASKTFEKSTEAIAKNVTAALAAAANFEAIVKDNAKSETERANALGALALNVIKADTYKRNADSAVQLAKKAAKGLEEIAGKALIAKANTVAKAATDGLNSIKAKTTEGKKSLVASLETLARGLDPAKPAEGATIKRLAKAIAVSIDGDIIAVKANLLKKITPALSTTSVIRLARATVTPPAPVAAAPIAVSPVVPPN